MIDCGEAFGGERKIASGLYQFYRPEDIEVSFYSIYDSIREN